MIRGPPRSTLLPHTPLLRSLREDGLLDESDLYGATSFPQDRVDYPRVTAYKTRILDKAWQNFRAGRGAGLKSAFEAFVRKRSEEHTSELQSRQYLVCRLLLA